MHASAWLVRLLRCMSLLGLAPCAVAGACLPAPLWRSCHHSSLAWTSGVRSTSSAPLILCFAAAQLTDGKSNSRFALRAACLEPGLAFCKHVAPSWAHAAILCVQWVFQITERLGFLQLRVGEWKAGTGSGWRLPYSACELELKALVVLFRAMMRRHAWPPRGPKSRSSSRAGGRTDSLQRAGRPLLAHQRAVNVKLTLGVLTQMRRGPRSPHRNLLTVHCWLRFK